MIVYYSGVTNEMRDIRNLLSVKRESKRNDLFRIATGTNQTADENDS